MYPAYFLAFCCLSARIFQVGADADESVATIKIDGQTWDDNAPWTLSWNGPLLTAAYGYASESLDTIRGLTKVFGKKLNGWHLGSNIFHGGEINGESINWIEWQDAQMPVLVSDLDEHHGKNNPHKLIVVCNSDPKTWHAPQPLVVTPQQCPPMFSYTYHKVRDWC